MEAVRAFNNELSSLYEVKPPVSRAKMTHVTKCAIKAIKFYKHVVQSVEKFILKCKPEYKVPGLYVIDSIVRQSRHQFGQEKDVYAPRFTKNIVVTFQNLFKCPTDERSKIVRVLNLWQKNGVFPIEVIQPLMDLAGDPNNADLAAAAQRAVERVVPTPKSSQQKAHTPAKPVESAKVKANPVMNSQASADSILTTQTDMLNTVNQLLQQTQQPQSLDEQQQQLHQLQILQQQLLEQTQTMQHPEDQGAVIDNTLLAQIQTLTNQLLSKTGDLNKPPEPSFDKKLLDFDYGESDEDDDRKEEAGARNSSGPVQHLLTDPALMEHIQQMSQTIQKTEQLKNELNIQEQMRQQMLQQQQEEFDQQINQGPGIGRPPMHPGPSHPVMAPYPGMIEPPLPPDSSQDMETDDVIIIHDDTDFQRDRSHRGRDRSRSPKRRRRSRSRSRDRRKRSRSRDRRRRSRSGDREKAREKERERWKKRLPPIKEKHVSVCSTTIWVGHLAKLTSEEELVRELENYGAVDSINMIPPRGCAFVCMNRRKDAAKAVEKMKGLKINGSAIKIAWAPGKSMKDLGFKDMWNVDLGVTYVPWDKLPTDPSLLVDGGMIDEDTIPDHLKELAAAMHQTEAPTEEKPDAASVNNVPVPIGLPPGGPPSLPPGQPPFPQMPGLPPANSIRVLQPGQPVGLLNPMLIPMPGQTLANMPGAQVGMHPIMSLTQPRLPQVNAAGPIPLMSIPNQTSTTSAGSQLNAAIQNIMSSSGGPTAVTQAVPGMVRPGFSGPRPGMFQPGFNPPGFNPNVPPPHVPPPNFRLPPPAFGGSSAPLGDGDSTPEQDEGQATVTKVISNDWPSKFPNREGDDRDQFPKTPGFGQPPSDIRMPLPHEQNLLPSSQAGNRLPPPRGPAPPVFSQHNSPMNANSPRPLLGPRMMQPERPDMNGPSVRPFMVGPQGIAGMNRPFGPGAMGNQMRPQGPGDMGGPQPLMGNRFGGPRNPGQSLLGIRPGFPGSRMLGPPQQRFGSNPPGGPGGPRPQSFGHPMDDRIRPLFGDSPNRPFERPDFDRFGDRPRFHHPRGNGPDDRPLVPDRWGPLDGPPGLDRERDPGDRGGPFRDRFERNEFRRDDDGNPDWRVNRRESRNHRMPFEDNEMASPGRRRDSRGRHGDRDEQDKGGDRDRDRDRERDRDRGRDRDRDRSRRSRWSNLDPSQTGEAKENFSEPAEHMDDSVNMETVDMNISANSGEHDEEKTKGSVLQSAGVESDLMAQSQTSESIDKSQVDVVKEPEVGAGTVEALPEVLKELPEAQSNTDPSTGQLNEAAMPVSEILATIPSEPSVVPSESIDSVPAAVSQHTAPPVETEQQREVDQSQVTPANGSSTHAKEEPVVQKQPNDIVLNESTAEKPCPAKTQSPMEEGELEPGEVSS